MPVRLNMCQEKENITYDTNHQTKSLDIATLWRNIFNSLLISFPSLHKSILPEKPQKTNQ